MKFSPMQNKIVIFIVKNAVSIITPINAKKHKAQTTPTTTTITKQNKKSCKTKKKK
jgi:hypothetical protein